MRPLLAALFGLNAGIATAIQDGSLLIQAGRGSYVPAFTHSRPKLEPHKFPLQRGDYQFVASASFKLNVAGMHIHCYDVALYVNRNSSAWKSIKAKDAMLDQIVGEAYFVIVAKSSFVSRKIMAGFVDRLPFFASKLGIHGNLDETLGQYKKLYLNGPKVKVGSEIIIMPNRTGVTPYVDGRFAGTCPSDWLGRTVVEAYLGPNCDLPEFRNRAFSQMAEGFPDVVTDPAVVSADLAVPWWLILIIVIAITNVLGCLAGLAWYTAKKWRSAPAS